MKYTPMSADEAAKLSIRPAGVYPFDVINAEAKKSKKGDDMIALALGFYDESGARFTVKDWLVHSANRWSEKKFYDFAQATGLGPKYSSGTLDAEDCLGRSGYASVGIEKGKPKDDGSGNFPDRNNVKYYTQKPEAKKGEPTAAQLANQSSGVDEDAPF